MAYSNCVAVAEELVFRHWLVLVRICCVGFVVKIGRVKKAVETYGFLWHSYGARGVVEERDHEVEGLVEW